VLVVGEHVVHRDLERSVDELAPPADVVHHRVDPPILSGNRVLPGDVKDDIFRQELRQGAVVAGRPRLVLSAEKRLVRMHAKTLSDGTVGTRASEARGPDRRKAW
jgi:hypothetical protein